MSGPIVLGLRLLLALALYIFLFWTLWTIWQDLMRSGVQAARQKAPPIRLEVHAKRRSPVFKAFTQPEVTLGRDPACDIPLMDEAVSAHHARLRFHHGQWWIEDLESTNGTRLNQAKLTTATVLTNGDEIKCGSVRLLVSVGGEPSIPPAPAFKED